MLIFNTGRLGKRINLPCLNYTAEEVSAEAEIRTQKFLTSSLVISPVASLPVTGAYYLACIFSSSDPVSGWKLAKHPKD